MRDSCEHHRHHCHHGHDAHHKHRKHREHPCARADHPMGGGGGRRERIFASGNLKLVALHLLAQKPGHGYDIIKSLSELVGDDYSPSPGTIYPTLAMMVDLGWVTAEQDGNGRKNYRITAEGQAELEEKKDEIESILAHLSHCRSRAHARRVPEIVRAMENLKLVLRMRFGDSLPDPAITHRIAEIIDRAAVEIERI